MCLPRAERDWRGLVGRRGGGRRSGIGRMFIEGESLDALETSMLFAVYKR